MGKNIQVTNPKPTSSKFNLKNRILKDSTKALLKGSKKQLEKIAKLEAKCCHNFIICSVMRLKLAKVVH